MPAVAFGHSYNAANQRIGETVSDTAWLSYPSGAGTTAYTANNLNQYTAVGAVTPTYDGNGNLTFDGAITLGHDPENRLVSASGGGNAATYAFDPRGRRKVRTVNGTTTITVTGADNRELLDYDGATGQIVRWYAYGPGPNAVLNQMNVASGTRDTLLPDLLGSIVASVDSGTGTIAPFGYRPYGTTAAAPAPFGYTGQRVDQETGLYYYRARHYSPAWGRFAQADPIGYEGGINLYAYVFNDPLNLTDSGGLAPDPSTIYSYATAEQQSPAQSFWSFLAPPAAVGTAAATAPIWAAITLAAVLVTVPSTSTSSMDQPPPQILFHYTTQQGMAGIVASQQINPSLRAANPNDVRYGEGQYFTDIAPGTRTGGQISRALVGNPFSANRFTNYVAIDVRGLPIAQGRPNVFVLPNTRPLNIEGRLDSFGANQLTGRGQ